MYFKCALSSWLGKCPVILDDGMYCLHCSLKQGKWEAVLPSFLRRFHVAHFCIKSMFSSCSKGNLKELNVLSALFNSTQLQRRHVPLVECFSFTVLNGILYRDEVIYSFSVEDIHFLCVHFTQSKWRSRPTRFVLSRIIEANIQNAFSDNGLHCEWGHILV